MQIEEPLIYGSEHREKRQENTCLGIRGSEIEISRQYRDKRERDVGIDKDINQLEAAEKYAQQKRESAEHEKE